MSTLIRVSPGRSGFEPAGSCCMLNLVYARPLFQALTIVYGLKCMDQLVGQTLSGTNRTVSKSFEIALKMPLMFDTEVPVDTQVLLDPLWL